MDVQFEIFETKEAGDVKTNNINTLFGYPHGGTITYRKLIKKYDANEWAGAVTEELINACKDMTYNEKLPYYNENELESFQWLIDNDWFDSPV